MGILKHGHTRRSLPKRRTRLYTAWQNMHTRCRNPNDRCYADYGGRGIRVSSRWAQFSNFEKDMGPHPGPGFSLERQRNSGNYTPRNCRWASPAEQGQNKRNNVYLKCSGKLLSLSEWSRRTGLAKHIITNRIRSGWAVERALTQSRRNYPKHRRV